MERWKILQPRPFMGCERTGHRYLVRQRKRCWDFFRDETDQTAWPLDAAGDEYAESKLLFTPATQFHSTVEEYFLFRFQNHKETLRTKVIMSVMLLACFITQTKHVNFNVSFVPIKLYSCYLWDIKLVSMHNAVKFLIFHSRFIFYFSP